MAEKEIEKIWLANVKDGVGSTNVVSDCELEVGDVVRIEYVGTCSKTMLGEVAAVVETENCGELHQWIRTASDGRIDQRKVTGIWKCRPEMQ